MPIFDLANNALPLASTGQLIGFQEVDELVAGNALNLTMYDFLIQPIRTEDEVRGAFFVKRFLDGPQIIWQETQESILKLKTLFSVDDIPDRLLKFLKNIVGWTSELANITDPLDFIQLRRLIRTSGDLWNTRGPEASIENILRQLTGTRLRLWNWFDFRWIVDETGMGAESDGRDPWMIGAPGEGLADEFRFNIRIVDDGFLDQQLVFDVANLMRPSGERIELAFIDFLDLFTVADDVEQWLAVADVFTVADGNLKLTDLAVNQEVITEAAAAALWTDITAFWRVKGSSTGGATFGGFFMYQSDGNTYRWQLDTEANELTVERLVAAATDWVVVVDLDLTAIILIPEIFFGVRVEAIDTGAGTTQIKVFIDNIQVFEDTRAGYTVGNLGMYSEVAASAEFDEIEMFQSPLEVVEVDINS